MTDNKTTPQFQSGDNSSGNNNGSGFQFTIPPHPNTQFDEVKFLTMLEGSISLSLKEKQNVIDAIPRLSIQQINDLFAIFEEEQDKFSELEDKFGNDITKLKDQRKKELDLEKNKKIEEAENKNDEDEAERIKKELGL